MPDPYDPTKNPDLNPNPTGSGGYADADKKAAQFYTSSNGGQYSKPFIGGTRMANNLYGPNGAAFGPISSDRYFQAAQDVGNRSNDPLQQQQNSYIQMLQAQASGQGPSAAQAQLRSATDQNVASAMGMAASGRGPGAAGAGYQAANLGAAANQQAANQSAIIRAQEMQSATQQLGGAMAGVRGQNMNEQQQRDSMVKFYMQQGASADQANRQASMDLEKLRMQQSQAQEAANNSAYYGIGDPAGAQLATTGLTTAASIIGAASVAGSAAA